jgi:hypothetical protein
VVVAVGVTVLTPCASTVPTVGEMVMVVAPRTFQKSCELPPDVMVSGDALNSIIWMPGVLTVVTVVLALLIKPYGSFTVSRKP